MGCLHIILDDRFNEQIQEIYRRAFLYIVNQMAWHFEKLSTEKASLISRDTSKELSKKSDEKVKCSAKDFEIELGLGMEIANRRLEYFYDKNISDIENQFQNLCIYSANYETNNQPNLTLEETQQ